MKAIAARLRAPTRSLGGKPSGPLRVAAALALVALTLGLASPLAALDGPDLDDGSPGDFVCVAPAAAWIFGIAEDRRGPVRREHPAPALLPPSFAPLALRAPPVR